MDARAVIVGAGPAGALLAYLLSSRGIETLLLERQSDFDREFRGEILMPGGLRALQAADVSLDRVATSVPEKLEAFINGRRFLEFRPADLGGRFPTAVSQPQLLEHLVALAEATGCFELRRGAAVRKVERDASGKGVSLRIKSVGRDAEETLRAPYLIGADGRASVVRRDLGASVRSRSTPLDVVWFKLPYPEAWEEPRVQFTLGHGHLMIAVHSPDGLLQVAWVILKGSYGELKARGVSEWVDQMAAYAPPELSEHLVLNRERFSRPFLLDAIADRVTGWAGPSTLLIGDAAHTMSPVGAQGLNVALRDAIVAANELVPAIRSGADVDAAAARVELQRGREIDVIQRLASLPPRVVMGRTPLHELARRAIAAVAGTRLARARGAQLGSFFFDGVTQVELVV